MEVWIGLAHVKPNPGNDLLDGARGAFVPVLALASCVEEFTSKVMGLLRKYNFRIPEIEDIEPLKIRLARGPVDSAIVKLASSISEDNNVAFSSFETYEDV